MKSSSHAGKWETQLHFFLKVAILASGVFQVLFGETTIGVLTLISLALIIFPSFFTRKKINHFPIEIEILLFVMVFLQLVLGEARDFYTEVPYYDKIVHFMLPLFIGLIGFLILYALSFNNQLKVSTKSMIFMAIVLSLGIGAFWEIIEYLSDQVLYPRIDGWHHFQGNAQQDALHDTMSDMILDTMGGVFGAALSLWFITKATTQKSKRLPELLSEILHTKS